MNGNLLAQIVALDLVMPVRDISLGGFAVEAPLRFAHGEVHELMLCRDGDAALTVRARAAYCHAKRDPDQLFITGWEALGDPETARVMTGLVNRWLAVQGEATALLARGGAEPYHGGPPTTDSPKAFAGFTRGA